MAINRLRKSNFPAIITWKETGNHVVRIENQISSICVGTTANLTDAKIGQGIAQISADCFKDCINLSSLTFVEDYVDPNGNSVTGTRIKEVGNQAFYNCSSLHQIKFNDDLVEISIGNSAFRKSGISSIVVNTKTVGTYAFENADDLLSVQLSATGSIGNYAFANTDSLKKAVVKGTGSNTSTVGRYAFARSNVQSASLTCNNSSNRLFHNCKSLTSASVNAKVLKYGDFAGCTSLKTLSLRNLVTIDLTLDSATTLPCTALTNLIDDSGKNIATLWYKYDNTDANFYYADNPSGMKDYLKLGVFDYCSSLTSLTFPSTFRGIDKNCLNKEYRYEYKYQWKDVYGYAYNQTDAFYIKTTDIPLFYHSEIPEIKFDIVPDDPDGRGDAYESVDGLSVYLYPKVFSEIHDKNNADSEKQTVIKFNDTYDQIYSIVYDANGKNILDDIIQTTLDTNRPGSIVFQFKDSTFDPSVNDTLLLFSNAKTEIVVDAVPIRRDPDDPSSANVCIDSESSVSL